MYFQYDQKVTESLKQKDRRLGEVIDKIIEREIDTDLFSSVVHPFRMTFKKAEYTTDFATRVKDGVFNLEGV